MARSGGVFRDLTIHDFDMARFLLGEEPTAVIRIAETSATRRSSLARRSGP